MKAILSSPLLWIGVSILCYEAGLQIKKRFDYSFLNPMIVGTILLIFILYATNTDLATYNLGGDFISLFLVPATAVLAVPIYRQRKLLKENWLPIVLGAFVGSLVSVVSVIGFVKLFGLDEIFMLSFIPKSVTTAIGIEISAALGGVPAITIVSIVIAGITGAVVMPALFKVFRIDDSIAKGIALGTASHAIGTTRAIEMGEVEGAMSGLAIGIAGIFTVIISLFLPF